MEESTEPVCTQCWGRGFVFTAPKYHTKSAMDPDYLSKPIYVQVPCEKCQSSPEIKEPTEPGWYWFAPEDEKIDSLTILKPGGEHTTEYLSQVRPEEPPSAADKTGDE